MFLIAFLVAIVSAGELPGRLLHYRTTDRGNLSIEVFFPPDWMATDQRPAVLFFHGGGFVSGDRSQFLFQARYLASRGLVAATADYRTLDKHGTLPHKSIADGREAVRSLKRSATSLGIDPARLVVGGASAGGIIAANTAYCPGWDEPGDDFTVSCRPAALLLFNPVFEFQPKHLSALETIVALRDPTARASWLERITPLPNLRADGPPAILFYGTADPAWESGRSFLAAAKRVGNRTECWIAEGQPHGFFNDAPWREATTLKADEFLVRLGYLKGPPNLPAVTAGLIRAE